MTLIRWLASTSFFQAFASKEFRHLATMAAGAIASWLVAHNATQSDAASVAEGVSALLVGGGGYALSLLNSSDTEKRVAVAAATGQVVTAPEAVAVMRADATSPKSKDELLADLRAGGPK